MVWFLQKKFENKLGASLINDYFNINLYDFVFKYFFKINKDFFKKIETYLDLKNNYKVLDIGSGTSSFSIYLKNENPTLNIYDIDGSKEMLRIAEKKIKDENLNIKIEEALAENIPYEDNHFDRIVAIFLFSYIPKTIKPYAMKELYRVLKPNGKLVIVDVSNQGGLKKYWELFKYIPSPFFIEEGLNGDYFNILNNANFKNISELPIMDKLIDISIIEAYKN
jgi:ubiquinone/menaquinone biosynthesis C-methylase UbiE